MQNLSHESLLCAKNVRHMPELESIFEKIRFFFAYITNLMGFLFFLDSFFTNYSLFWLRHDRTFVGRLWLEAQKETDKELLKLN